MNAPSDTWQSYLRPYQQSGSDWLAFPPPPLRGRILADGRGYGKTVQALAAVRKRQAVMAKTENPAFIVLTTGSGTRDWRREAAKFWPELKVHVLGDEVGTQRKNESDEDFHQRKNGKWIELLRGMHGPAMIVASYESMDRLVQEVRKYDLIFDSIVIDEAHNLKKAKIGRSEESRILLGRCTWCALLTGTPVHNRAQDLYNLLDMCCPSRYGGFWTFAKKYFMTRVSKGNWGQTVDELLHKDKLKRDTTEVLLSRSAEEAFGSLPPVVLQLKPVDVRGAVRISPARLNRVRAGSDLDLMLRQCAEKKMKAAVELAGDIGAPVVLYTWKREHAEQLCAALNKAKISASLATGDTPPKARDAIIEKWKVGAATALVCTMDAVKESATLTRASDMIFLDFDWLGGKVLQNMGRTHPSRQPSDKRRPSNYYFLCVKNGPDEIVAEALVEKFKEAEGLTAKDADSIALVDSLSPLVKQVDRMSAPAVLSDLVKRMEARAERLADLGL